MVVPRAPLLQFLEITTRAKPSENSWNHAFSILGECPLLNIALDRPHDYSKQHYNASRDQPSIAAKPWQKLTKRKYPFVLLP